MNLAGKNKILVTCSQGIAPYLEQELENLGFPIYESGIYHVFTFGTLQDTISLNLQLRTATRVHYLLHEFKADTPDELYHNLRILPWENVIDSRGYLSIVSSVTNDNIRDSRFANLKSKDAIVDRIMAKEGHRPDSGPDRSKTVLFLYWKNNRGAIYLDTSGESLSKRGYRKIPFKAPMQETLAAAVLLAAGWNGEGHFVNPMCGSGTLGIEAALIALGKAPGLLRNNFGFMHHKGYDKETYLEIRRALHHRVRKKTDFRFILSDIDPNAIKAAQHNAKTAGVDHLIEFSQCGCAETTVPEGRGRVVVNPGYGMRLENIRSLERVYSGLGDFSNKNAGGTRLIFLPAIRFWPKRLDSRHRVV